MGDIRVEPFEIRHFFMVDGREAKFSENDEWIAWLYYNRSFFADGKRSAFTCFDGNKAMGCAGMMIFNNLGELWMHIGDGMVRRPIWFHKMVTTIFDAVRSQSGVLRVETSIDEARAKNIKWIENLGLKFESAMPKFGPHGETFNRYAWIKED